MIYWERKLPTLRQIFWRSEGHKKTGAERFRNNPDLYLRRGFYCLTETLESQDCVNFLIFRFSHVQKIKFV